MACEIPTGPNVGRLHVFRQCGRVLPVLGLPCTFDEPEVDAGSGSVEPTFPDLAVSQIVDPDIGAFSAGDTLTFTVTTTNIGDAIATGCTLTWVIPGLGFGAAIDLGVLGIGETVNTEIEVVLAEDQENGNFTMTSTATTADEEPNLTNNTAETPFSVATPEEITDIAVTIEELEA